MIKCPQNYEINIKFPCIMEQIIENKNLFSDFLTIIQF